MSEHRSVVSLAPSPIDIGDVSWRYLLGIAQKKGSAEATSGGINSVVGTFVPLLLYLIFLVNALKML
jgi:hypothetical protein